MVDNNNQEEGRQERKKRELREKIVQVAVHLFNEQGFYNTTMEQIAETADVSRKTLYNYFPVKEAIADAYIREISMGLAQEKIESILKLPDTRSRLLAALTNAYSWVEQNLELTRVVLGYRMKADYQAPPGEKTKTGTQSLVEAILTQGQENGQIKQDFSVEMMVRYIDLLRGSLTWGWLKEPGKSYLPEAMEKLVDLVLYGASADGRQAL